MDSISSLFKQGFIFGLGYFTVFGISISMVMLGGLIKGCTDDVKELKEKTFAVKEKETVDKKDNKVD